MNTLEEVKKGINIIFPNNEIIDVRAFGAAYPYSKQFLDHDEAAKVISALSDSGKYEGIYYTLNETSSDNKPACDYDITRRKWLFIDCDAVRPKNTSSTDKEKEKSHEVAKAIFDTMDTRGWPRPVYTDSGNGSHLLYRIDLPNDQESSDLLRGILATLGKLFSSEDVIIDPVVFNAGRITKAYGTLVKKGEPTVERPHRYSKIIDVGEEKTVTKEQLQKLVDDFKVPIKPSTLEAEKSFTTDVESLTPERMEEFLEHCDINHYPAEPFMYGGESGVRFVIEQCPWTEEHSGKDLKKDAAVFVMESGTFGFNCFHSHCSERTWKDFRAKVSEGKKHFSFVDTGNVTVGGKKLEPPQEVDLSIDLLPLSEVKEEALEWLWPGKIPKGSITIFSGDPSKGKSLFTFDIIARGSVGADFIDGEINETGVFESIILSAEDDPNSIIKPRLMIAGADCTKVFLLQAVQDKTGERMLRLDKDMLRLRCTLEKHPNVKLVMVDPLSNYCGKSDMWRDQDMRSILMPLTHVARDYGVSFVIIWHNKKGKENTGLQKMAGSLGAAGVARMAWAFMESENSPNAKVMLQVKENYGKFHGIEFETLGVDRTIDGKTTSVPKVVFNGITYEEANTLMAKQNEKNYHLKVNLKKKESPYAAHVMGMCAKTGDAVKEDFIIDEGKKLGLIENTIKQTRITLKEKGFYIKSEKRDDGVWWIRVPDIQADEIGEGFGQHTII